MLLKQSSTAQPLMFLMIDSADHVSPKTGLTVTATLSKAGGSFAAVAGAVTEVGSGWYKVAGNATDTATLGPLILHATATGADPTDAAYLVMAVDPLSATAFITGVNSIAPPSNWNLTSIDSNGRVDVIKINGTSQTARDIGSSVLLSVGTGTGQINLSGGAITTVTNLTNNSPTITGTQTFNLTGNITGNLSGSVASVTGNVGGTVATVTTLTNLPAIPADWLTAAGVKTDAVAKIQSGLSTYAGVDTAGTTTLLARVPSTLPTFPTNFSLMQIDGSGLVNAALQTANVSGDAMQVNTVYIGGFAAETGADHWLKVSSDSVVQTSGGGGDGDITVDHNYGGTDAMRVMRDGVPIDNAVIRAYVAADYTAGEIDPKPPTTTTGSDGRWLTPLELDADDYRANVYDPATKTTSVFTFTVS